MGLGKTVMTIALILTKPGASGLNCQKAGHVEEVIPTRANDSCPRSLNKVRGGTLIVCPMALLGQWKVRLSDLISELIGQELIFTNKFLQM